MRKKSQGPKTKSFSVKAAPEHVKHIIPAMASVLMDQDENIQLALLVLRIFPQEISWSFIAEMPREFIQLIFLDIFLFEILRCTKLRFQIWISDMQI